MTNFLQLKDIAAYQKSFKLSNYVWTVTSGWDFFAKKTIGDQFVRAVDSISANIAEGFGRYSKKDKIRCYRIARGSATESLDWNQKAKARNLLTEKEYQQIFEELKNFPKEINHLISFTNSKLKT